MSCNTRPLLTYVLQCKTSWSFLSILWLSRSGSATKHCPQSSSQASIFSRSNTQILEKRRTKASLALASLKLYYNKHSSQNDCAIIFLFFLIAWVRCWESVPSLLTSSDLCFCFCRLLFADTSPRHCIISLRFFFVTCLQFLFFPFFLLFNPLCIIIILCTTVFVSSSFLVSCVPYFSFNTLLSNEL